MPFDQQQFQIEVSPVARVLREARDYLRDPDCWIKDASDGRRRVCAIVAVARIAKASANDEIKNAAWNALEGQVPKGYAAVVLFNDAPETTHADVLALFDRAIEAAS